MKISVENLGTIHKGEISLDKELTIFTGENNSGKSYMSYLVYATINVANKANPEYTYYAQRWINFAYKENLISENFFIDNGFYLKVNQINKKLLELRNKFHLIFINDEINRYLHFKNYNDKFSINLKIYNQEDENKFIDNREFTININQKLFNLKQTTEDVLITSPNYDINDQKAIINYMLYVFCPKTSSTYFIPAERTAINMFYTDIIKNRALENEELKRMGNISMEKIELMKQQGLFLPRSMKPIDDYLYFCYDFRKHVLNPPTAFADLATELENLLGGGVGVSAFGDLQFQPTKEASQIPLYLTSSLVKSWSGVVIYLRHLAQEGDILMIDEPEINLHPKTQVQIARFLAKMVNRGIRIVVSTHSDYIIKELNNLIMLKNENPKAKKLLKKLNIDENAVLEYNKVAVYSFENHTIRAVPTSVTGFDVQALDEQIIKQGNESRLIYETLYDNEN